MIIATFLEDLLIKSMLSVKFLKLLSVSDLLKFSKENKIFFLLNQELFSSANFI